MDKRVILFILANVLNVWSSPHLTDLMNEREIFCGKKLTEALEFTCNKNYNGPTKKSMTDIVYNDYEGLFSGETDQDNMLDFPFLQKEDANLFLPMRIRRRKGIINECCYKPCTYKHLSLYCS